MGCYSFRESNEFIIENDKNLQLSHSSMIKFNKSLTKRNERNACLGPLDSSLDNKFQKINEFHTDITLNESKKDKKEEKNDYIKELRSDYIDKNTEKSFQNLDENFLYPNLPIKSSNVYDDNNNAFDVKYNNTILSLNNLHNLQDISSSNIFTSKLERYDNINIYNTGGSNAKNILTSSVLYTDNKINEEYMYELIVINKFGTFKWKKHKKMLPKFI